MNFFKISLSLLILILGQQSGGGINVESEFSTFLRSRELLQSSSVFDRMVDSPSGCRTTAGNDCIFPFKYKGETYSQCTNADYGSTFWCATSVHSSKEVNNYGVCQKNCSWTTNPNVKACQTATSKICVFPFKYNNKEYRQCTSIDNGGVKWCATSVDDSGNAKGFGDCLDCTCNNCTTTTNEECLFPFRYKGYTYYRCTNSDFGNTFWCATSRYSSGEANQYGACQNDCVRTLPVSSDVCQTTSGQACVFPFKYNDETFQNCTTKDNNNVKWCATSLKDNMEYLGFGNCLTSSCG